jgi:hypothetical protein
MDIYSGQFVKISVNSSKVCRPIRVYLCPSVVEVQLVIFMRFGYVLRQ